MGIGGVKAGSLNRKIDLYKQIRTADSSGQEVYSYCYDFSLMSNPRPLRSVERTKFSRDEIAITEFTFVTYFKKNISNTHKIKFDGNFFDIIGLAPMGANSRRFMEISAQILDQTTLVIQS